jgi:hypothetical protein
LAQRCCSHRQPDALQVIARRQADLLAKQPVQVAWRDMRHRRQRWHVPVLLRGGADGVLHPVQRRMQMVAKCQ